MCKFSSSNKKNSYPLPSTTDLRSLETRRKILVCAWAEFVHRFQVSAVTLLLLFVSKRGILQMFLIIPCPITLQRSQTWWGFSILFFCFIKILEFKKSILLLFWRHYLWVSSHKLSILFQLSRVCHPVHDNTLPMWLALCSSWESPSDLSFHGTLLCRVRSQKQVHKLQWFTPMMNLVFRMFPRIYRTSLSVPTSGLTIWHLDFLTSWVRSLTPRRQIMRKREIQSSFCIFWLRFSA